MIDLDAKIDVEALGRVPEDMYLRLGEGSHGPAVKFRYVCGADGYRVSTSFVDREGFGGGDTPRWALRSLAASLRALADLVEKAAGDPKP
jgi:hypothetical protein